MDKHLSLLWNRFYWIMEAWVMSVFSQFEAPILASTLVLLVMGFLSLMISLSLRSKSRAIRKLPRNMGASVMDKTFNVFSPYPEQREIIHGSIIVSMPIIVIFAGFVFSFVVLATLIQMGLLVGLITFILCASLMITDVSSEIHKNASLLVRAVKNGTDLGQGDLNVLSIVEKTLPKLKTYYLSLAVMFFALSAALRYILPSVASFVAYSLGAIIALTASGGIMGPAYALLLFVIAIVMIRLAVTEVRMRIFGLPQPETSISLDKPFEAVRARAGFCYVWEHDQLLRRPPPEPEETPDSEREKSESSAKKEMQ